MPRRILASACLALLVVGATACNPGRPPAATVGGTDISVAHVDAMLDAFAEANESQIDAIVGDGAATYSSALTANVLTFLISQVAAYEEADERGLVSDDGGDEQAARAYLIEQLGGAEDVGGNGQDVLDALPEATQTWLIDLAEARIALANELGGDADLSELAREQYEQQVAADPNAYSSACLRLIVVPEEQIPDVQARLDAGEDFGDVSADVSVDPQVAEARGENPCIPLAQLGDSPEAQEFAAAEPGDVVGPTPFQQDPTTGETTYALLERGETQTATFEDVEEQLVAQIEQSGGAQAPSEAAVSQAVQERLDSDPPRVDPRFGSWVPGVAGLGGGVEQPPGAREASIPEPLDPTLAEDPASAPPAG